MQLSALDRAVDLTSFQETSLLEIMTVFVPKVFFLPIGIEISYQKTKSKEERASQLRKSHLLRTQDLSLDSLALAGYVEVLVIPTGARRIKVVEEKPAHSYLGNLPCRPKAAPRTSPLPVRRG